MSVIHGVNYGTPTLDLNFARNKSLIDTVTGRNLVTFTRASTGTYVGADGLIKSAVADEPRFDHNPVTGESLGLLVEEQRTNSILNSSNSDTWSNSACILLKNHSTSPDGLTNAVKLSANTSNSQHYIDLGGTGEIYSISVYAKSLQLNTIFIGYSAIPNNFGASFNLSTGTVTSVSGHSSPVARIENAGNGWYKCSVSLTQGGQGGFIVAPFTSMNSVYTGDGSSGILIWAPQSESGSFPTSYIPTAGSTVTRSADQASITGTNFSSWYNSSEGTAYIDVISKGISNGLPYQTYFSFNSSAGDRWGIAHQNGTSGSYPSNSVIPYVGTGGAFSNTLNGTFSAGQKISIGMHQPNGTNIQSSRDGGSIQTVSTSRNPLITNLLLGGQISDNSGLMGTLKRLTYYPTRLQDFQLRQLTK